MSISTVKAEINGIEYNLIYNSSTGKWEASIPAPAASSFNQPDGKFNVQLTATNEAGSSKSIDRSDAEFGSVLALKVIEKQPPVITVTSPGTGAYITTATPTVKFRVIDNSISNGGDSGINLSSLELKVDGAAVSNEIAHTAIDGGYECECVLSALSEGSHTITIDVSDNDGNSASQASAVFTVDTVPPTLDVISPSDGLITNSQTVTVSGTTNDATSTAVTVKISVNGKDQGDIDVDSSGNFSKEITLDEAENEIVITATDSAGKTSTVTRNVTLDVSIPVFTAVSLTPNPVDAGATLILSVEVE